MTEQDTSPTSDDSSSDEQPQQQGGSVVFEPATVEACQRDYAGGADARRGFDKAAKRKRGH